MYVLEIKTNKTVKKIENPRKAKAVDIAITTFVRVMDGKGKWHIIGKSFYLIDAECMVDDINNAIKHKKPSICVELN